MSTHRIELEPAYLLHRKPYRETSVLAEVLSIRHGRLGLVARGARGKRSALGAILQPFRPLLISWSGRGDLRTLTAAEPDGPVNALRGRALLSGFYLHELILRLVHRHDAAPDLYSAYAHAIADLEASDKIEAALRIFEKRLLAAIGYGLLLDRDADTGAPVRPDQSYRFEPERGVTVADAAGRTGVPVSGRSLLALAGERLEHPQELSETKRLMRTVLALYLGAKPLVSRELFSPAP